MWSPTNSTDTLCMTPQIVCNTVRSCADGTGHATWTEYTGARSGESELSRAEVVSSIPMSPPISPRFVLPEPHPTQDKGHPSLTPHSCSSEREAVRHRQALVRDEEITSRGGNTSSAHVLTRTNHATWTGRYTTLLPRVHWNRESELNLGQRVR